MISTSGKIADKIAAKQAAKNVAAPVKKGPHKKLATALKGAKLTKIKRANAKTKKLLDKKANPKSLAKSRKIVSMKLKKLGLVSAGFGRYHKGKGKPVTHWVMRNPKNGLYVLADKEIRSKLLGKKAAPAAAPAAPAAPNRDLKPIAHEAKKILKHSGGRPSNAKKAHEAKKAELTKMHLARLDKKRAEMLQKKGKSADKPMTKKEQAKRESSVRKLHRVLDKHFKKEQTLKRAKKSAVKKVIGK